MIDRSHDVCLFLLGSPYQEFVFLLFVAFGGGSDMIRMRSSARCEREASELEGLVDTWGATKLEDRDYAGEKYILQ